MSEVTAETLTRLSFENIRMFESRIKAGKEGHPNVRVDECERYLSIWQSIKQKGEWDKLTKIERMEVMDALTEEADED
jgi:hypothetical protein